MYADRYSRRTKFDPASMGLALALNGTIVVGLIAFAAPHFVRIPDRIIDVWNIPLKSPPPPIDPAPPVDERHADPPPTAPVDTSPPIDPTDTSQNPGMPYDPVPPWTGPSDGTGIGTGGGGGEPIKLTPVVIGPELDTRFAGGFQPEYPAGERRAEHQGRVVVRVLIGVDGRVKLVEKVSAASDAFFEATERRALQKWRFKPGTRDGAPIEAWKTIGVSFVLNDE
jgi:protein TonB